MRIQWFGHACFGLVDDTGFAVLTDPFDAKVGYASPDLIPDLVTMSHDHHDHNNAAGVGGQPVVLKGPGQPRLPRSCDSVRVFSVPAWHDEEQGRKRGPNTVFIFEMDGLRIAHLGDLGHRLSPRQLAEIGTIDVLLVPVGGTYTLDAKGAFDVIGQIRPKVAIPMHYQTAALTFKLAPVDDFLALQDGPVERASGSEVRFTREELAAASPTRVVVLEYR